VLRLNQISGWILRSITHLFENTGTIESGMARLGISVARGLRSTVTS